MAEGHKVTATDYLAAVAEVGPCEGDRGIVSTAIHRHRHSRSARVAPKGEATGDPVFCTFWTLLGLPAITLPLLTGEENMPLGVHLLVRRRRRAAFAHGELAGNQACWSMMTRDILVRGVAAIVLSILACGAAAPADQFPFDQEFLLDAAPMQPARKADADPAG